MLLKITVVFDNFGPYHVARLAALANRCDLLAIEVRSVSAEYAWKPTAETPFSRVTLNSSGDSGALRSRLTDVLSGFAPDVLFVPGWSSPEAIAAYLWASSTNTPVVAMSESQAIDFDRDPFKEWVKRRLVSHVAAALVGGTQHAEYAAELGIPRAATLAGYDVVDNAHFGAGARAARDHATALRARLALPERYFLASARFIEKKNLLRLLDAFAHCRALVAEANSDIDPWDMVLMGDGPLRGAIESKIAKLGLERAVHLPGFRQYADLPAFYGMAQAFVLPSTTEQWGLVVNEAMASGLPVLVSERCGAAPDLVEDGVNGYVFDPFDPEELAMLMARTNLSDRAVLARMGNISTAKIAAWSPETFAENALTLARTSLALPGHRMKWQDQIVALATFHWQRSSIGLT